MTSSNAQGSPRGRGFISSVAAFFTASVVGVSSGQAAIYFSDGFETQTDPLGNPPTGVAWRDVGNGDNHALVSSPVFAGATALRLNRTNDGTVIPSLIGVGTAGGLVGGNVLEFVFHINQVADPLSNTTHNFNAPIQNGIGFSNGQTLLSFGTLNGNLETYHVTDAGSNVNLGVAVPRNTAAYDALRFVLTLTNPTPTTLGGTYEVFIDTDDADGVATTSRGVYNLTARTIPVSEGTNPSIRLSRGSFTSASLYDDISISDVPEPASLAMALVGGLMMIGRGRRASND